MYPYRVSLALPWWNGATYRCALRSLRSGCVIEGPDLHALRSHLIEKLGIQEVVLCGSGSFALELALRACGVRKADEVIIPAFCCSAVALPVLSVGAVPVLADVGEELNLTVDTVAAALTRKTKAIIVPHLFGNPADIQAIVDLVRQRNVSVIDDAAQALGATIDGRLVGTFGHAGIVSFGNEKVCFGLGGGAVISHGDKRFMDNLTIDWGRPSMGPTVWRLLSTALRRWRRWTMPLQTACSRRCFPGSEALPNFYARESMANLSAAVAATLMKTLPENIAARAARVRAYQEALGGAVGLRLVPHQIGSACLTQVVRVLPRNRRRDLASELIHALGGAGYEIQGSYVPIHLLGHFDACVWDYLPYAERVWSGLVELPCEPEVSLTDIERIAGIVSRIVSTA